MKARTQKVLTVLRAVGEMLNIEVAAHTGTAYGMTRHRLKRAADKMAALAAIQRDTAQALTSLAPQLRALRAELRVDHMRPIVAIAKRCLADDAGLSFLKVPPRRATTMELIMAARVMAQAVPPHSLMFVKMGLPVDFTEQLRHAATRLEYVHSARQRHRATRMSASAGLIAMERECRGLIRIVDALVRPQIRHNATVLGRWAMTVRVSTCERVPRNCRRIGPGA